jgi:hypothetical protein
MFWSNLLHDLNYDFAHVVQCAVKVYEEIVDTFSSFNVFEYSGVSIHQSRTCHSHTTTSPSRSSLLTTDSDIEMQEVDLGVDRDVEEEKWFVIHQTDWNYENNLSFDNSPSI